MDTYCLKDALMGGPGHDGYAYQAAIYCVPCGRDIARKVFEGAPIVDDMTFNDSEAVPQPVFFGEADSAQHCDSCGKYCYGPQDDEGEGR